MSLDVWLTVTKTVTETKEVMVFENNITHNLNKMADAAGLYQALWRPEEIGAKRAGDLVGVLANGLAHLHLNPDKFKSMNPENKWGNYDLLVSFTKQYLIACCENPDAVINISR